jgi:sugar phosphate isomerase/epimerase
MMQRIGAQTIVWGEDIRDHMDAILTFLSENGFRGVETGIRHFYLDRYQAYREFYEKTGIILLGIHSGGKFWDPDQAGDEMKKIQDTVSFASRAGSKYLLVSGNPNETVASMQAAAATYNELGKRCLDAGLRLAYHNHHWELVDQGAILNVLMNETSAELVSLVLDTAWAYIAEMSVETLMHHYGDRIAYLHIKDVRQKKFCELGTGEIDHDLTIALARSYGIEWLVVEQDDTSLTAEESMKANMHYLRSKGIGDSK